MDSKDTRLHGLVKQIIEAPREKITRSDLTRAAVLVPIVVRGDEPRLVLTKRTMTVAKHKGQVSFPGGVREPVDDGPVENALREAREEVGLRRRFVSVVGMLDDFITTTGFLVTPVVGFVDPNTRFKIDPVEVDELFEARFSDFRNPDNYEYRALDGSSSRRFHIYRIGERIVWGATAGIIHKFMKALDSLESETRAGCN